MRTMRRVGVALLTALTLSTPVFAQSTDGRLSLNAAIGPSFANLGTTFFATARGDYKLTDRATLAARNGLRDEPRRRRDRTASPDGLA